MSCPVLESNLADQPSGRSVGIAEKTLTASASSKLSPSGSSSSSFLRGLAPARTNGVADADGFAKGVFCWAASAIGVSEAGSSYPSAVVSSSMSYLSNSS